LEAIPTWLKKFAFLGKGKLEKVDEALNGNRYKTPMQKFGNKIAKGMIAEYVSTGKIYNKNPVEVIREDKRKHILIGKKLIDVFVQKDIKSNN